MYLEAAMCWFSLVQKLEMEENNHDVSNLW